MIWAVKYIANQFTNEEHIDANRNVFRGLKGRLREFICVIHILDSLHSLVIYNLKTSIDPLVTNKIMNMANVHSYSRGWGQMWSGWNEESKYSSESCRTILWLKCEVYIFQHFGSEGTTTPHDDICCRIEEAVWLSCVGHQPQPSSWPPFLFFSKCPICQSRPNDTRQ